MPRCLPISTAPGASLRSATRAPGRSGRSDGIRLRSEHSPHEAASPAKESACRHTPTARPWGAGGSMAGIRHLGRGGLCGAVRHGAGCRSAWRPPEPPRAQGARYALGRPGDGQDVRCGGRLRTGEPSGRRERGRSAGGGRGTGRRTGCRRVMGGRSWKGPFELVGGL